MKLYLVTTPEGDVNGENADYFVSATSFEGARNMWMAKMKNEGTSFYNSTVIVHEISGVGQLGVMGWENILHKEFNLPEELTE